MKKLLLMSIFMLCAGSAQAGLFSNTSNTFLPAREAQKDTQFAGHLSRISTSNICGNILFVGALKIIYDEFEHYIRQNAEPLSDGIRSLLSDKPSTTQLGACANIVQHAAVDAMIISSDQINPFFIQCYNDEGTSTRTLSTLLVGISRLPIAVKTVDYGVKGITALQTHNTRKFIRNNLPSESQEEQTARLHRWQATVQEKKERCWTNSCKKEMDSIAAFLNKTDRNNK